jgi:hypothetical protein
MFVSWDMELNRISLGFADFASPEAKQAGHLYNQPPFSFQFEILPEETNGDYQLAWHSRGEI